MKHLHNVGTRLPKLDFADDLIHKRINFTKFRFCLHLIYLYVRFRTVGTVAKIIN